MDRIVRRNLTCAAFLVANMAMLFASAYTMTFHGFRNGLAPSMVAIILMIVFATYHVKQMRLLGRKGGALSILFGMDDDGSASDEGRPTRWWIHVGRCAIRPGFMVAVLVSVAFFVSERYLYGMVALLPLPILLLSFVFARMIWLRNVRT